jgi:hypothetical protein
MHELTPRAQANITLAFVFPTGRTHFANEGARERIQPGFRGEKVFGKRSVPMWLLSILQQVATGHSKKNSPDAYRIVMIEPSNWKNGSALGALPAEYPPLGTFM